MFWHTDWFHPRQAPGLGKRAPVVFVALLVLLFATSLDEELAPILHLLIAVAALALIVHFVRHLFGYVSDRGNRRDRGGGP